MRLSVLIEPSLKDAARPVAYVQKLAVKHPDAVVVSTGGGLAVTMAERAALEAGLRVAAFRPVPVEPGVAPPRWPSEEDEENPPPPPPDTRYRIVVYELRPDDPEHVQALWHPWAKTSYVVVGHEQAVLEALRLAWTAGDNRVVFRAPKSAWPPIPTDGAQVLE